MAERRSRSERSIAKAETTPLQIDGTIGAHPLTQPAEHLVLVHSPRFVPEILAAVGIVLLPVALCGYFASWSLASYLGATGVLFLGFSLVVSAASRKHIFDSQKKQLRVVQFGISRVFSTEGVLSIQLIEGGWHWSRQGQPQFFSYQCNLVIDDPSRARINITNSSDWDSTRELGFKLKELLRIPLQDEVSALINFDE